MANPNDSASTNDPYDLGRFLKAQEATTSAPRGNHERPQALALDVVHLPAV